MVSQSRKKETKTGQPPARPLTVEEVLDLLTHRFEMMCAGFTESQLKARRTEAIGLLAPLALSNFDAWSHNGGFADEAASELRRFRIGLERIASAGNKLSGTLEEAIARDAECFAQRILEDRAQLKRLASFDPNLPKLVDAILMPDDTESREREVRLRQTNDLLADMAFHESELPPIYWVIRAWLATRSGQVTAQLPNKLTSLVNGTESNSRRWALSLLAHWRAKDDQPLAALDLATRWNGTKPTPSELHEAILYASMADRTGNARLYMEALLSASPLTAITILADSRCSTAGNALLEGIVNYQLKARTDALHTLSNWSASARKVQELNQTLDSPLNVAPDLVNGAQTMQQSAASYDVIQLWFARSFATESEATLKRSVTIELNSLRAKCDVVARAAKKELDTLSNAREAEVSSSTDLHQQVVADARLAIAEKFGDPEKTQKGCIFGLIGGAVGVGGTIGGSVLLPMFGIKGSMNEFPGVLLYLLPCTPLGIAITNYLIASGRRMAAEAELERAISQSKAEHDKKVYDADLKWQSQIEAKRKQHASAEEKSQKVRQAIQQWAA